MLESIEYTELKTNKVLEYIKTHWQAFKEISADLHPSKTITYHLFESNQRPKHYLLRFESNYQHHKKDQKILPGIHQLEISQKTYEEINQKAESLLEQSYASLQDPASRQEFRHQLLSIMDPKERVELLKSQTKDDLERLQESVLKCIDATAANDDLKLIQAEINQLIASKTSYYEGAFGKLKL